MTAITRGRGTLLYACRYCWRFFASPRARREHETEGHQSCRAVCDGLTQARNSAGAQEWRRAATYQRRAWLGVLLPFVVLAAAVGNVHLIDEWRDAWRLA